MYEKGALLWLDRLFMPIKKDEYYYEWKRNWRQYRPDVGKG